MMACGWCAWQGDSLGLFWDNEECPVKVDVDAPTFGADSPILFSSLTDFDRTEDGDSCIQMRLSGQGSCEDLETLYQTTYECGVARSCGLCEFTVSCTNSGADDDPDADCSSFAAGDAASCPDGCTYTESGGSMADAYYADIDDICTRSETHHIDTTDGSVVSHVDAHLTREDHELTDEHLEKFTDSCVARPDAAVVATDYPINWIITDYTATSYTASVGDTVTFSWDGGHNVFLHPTGTCDDAGATEVSSSSPVIYTFTEAGSFTFACDVGEHCENGQILTFTVV
jgi:plastocyanin